MEKNFMEKSANLRKMRKCANVQYENALMLWSDKITVFAGIPLFPRH